MMAGCRGGVNYTRVCVFQHLVFKCKRKPLSSSRSLIKGLRALTTPKAASTELDSTLLFRTIGACTQLSRDWVELLIFSSGVMF